MRTLVSIVVIVALVAGGLAYAIYHPEIAAITPPPPASFDTALVENGAALAAIGDCAVCHTRPGGERFAGGLPLPTPFGTIHSTNITPDAETGIGQWSEEAFRRAMHEGIDRRGGHLYPAFPYDHFTKVTDEDIKAIYAFLMTQPAVASAPVANTLAFPFNQRMLMAGWNMLFLKDARFAPDPEKDEAWNRGAYLVEGLGHCGSCHTPRNMFGAEESNSVFAGAEIEGWHAPALNNASPAPVPWSADAIVNYLLDGWDEDHGIAAGPMTPVVNALADLSEDDAYAIAAYIRSFQDETDAKERADKAIAFAESREFGGADTPVSGPAATGDPAFARGAETFARVCANCHRAGGQTAILALTSTVNGPDPVNFLRIVDEGIQPPEGSLDRAMPRFGNSLTPDALADLATFVRAHFSQRGPWPDVPAAVRRVRTEK